MTVKRIKNQIERTDTPVKIGAYKSLKDICLVCETGLTPPNLRVGFKYEAILLLYFVLCQAKALFSVAMFRHASIEVRLFIYKQIYEKNITLECWNATRCISD